MSECLRWEMEFNNGKGIGWKNRQIRDYIFILAFSDFLNLINSSFWKILFTRFKYVLQTRELTCSFSYNYAYRFQNENLLPPLKHSDL